MQFYKDRILNAAQLKRLSEHKYSCTSASLMDAWLQPWWCWLVSKTPLWLAPNLITILGLIVNVFTTLILVWYSPEARSNPPWWSCALCALGVFIYQSLDAIDGKQARRTGSQSPLGELFDHGCDSISTVFIAVGACTSVRLGEYPTWMFFQCFCAMTLFYCAHWQAYVTGTLKMGRIDVTEAQYTIIVIHMISAIFGSEIWSLQLGPSIEMRYSVGAAAVLAATLTIGALVAAILAGGVGKNGSTVAIPGVGAPWALAVTSGCFAAQFTFAVEFASTFRVRGCGKNGSTVALPTLNLSLNLVSNTAVVMLALYLICGYVRVIMNGGVGKNGSTVAGTSILSPVIPFSLVVVPAFIIFQKSESSVYENHPILYILAFGMVAAKVTNRLVVAHMTKSEMDYYDWSLLGPAMLFLNQYFNNAIPEYVVLWLAAIWVCIDLVRYCGQICCEICDHLKISLFRITPAPPSLAGGGGGGGGGGGAGGGGGKSAPAQAHERNVTSDSEKSETEDSAPLLNFNNNSVS